jgi:enolase
MKLLNYADSDMAYEGKGVTQAVENINSEIKKLLISTEAEDQQKSD